MAENCGVGEGELGISLEVPVDGVYCDCDIADEEFVGAWRGVGCGLDGKGLGFGTGEPGC